MTLFLLGIVFLLVILHWATRGASPSNLGHREGGSGGATGTNMGNVCLCMSNRVGALMVAILTMILAVTEVLATFGEHVLRTGDDQNAYLTMIELHAVFRAWSMTSWIDFLAALMLMYGVLNKHVNSLTMWIVFKCFLLSMSAVSTLYASFHQHPMTVDGSSGVYRYRPDRVPSSDIHNDSATPSNGAWTGSYAYSSFSNHPVIERRENPFGIPFPLLTALLFPLQILCVYVVHKFRTELLYQEQVRAFAAAASSGGSRNGASRDGANDVPVAVQNFRFVPPGLFAYSADEVSVPPRNDYPPAYDEVAKHDKLPTYLEAVLNNNNGSGTSAEPNNSAESQAQPAAEAHETVAVTVTTVPPVHNAVNDAVSNSVGAHNN